MVPVGPVPGISLPGCRGVVTDARVCPGIACLQTGTPSLTTTRHTSRGFQRSKKKKQLCAVCKIQIEKRGPVGNKSHLNPPSADLAPGAAARFLHLQRHKLHLFFRLEPKTPPDRFFRRSRVTNTRPQVAGKDARTHTRALTSKRHWSGFERLLIKRLCKLVVLSW